MQSSFSNIPLLQIGNGIWKFLTKQTVNKPKESTEIFSTYVESGDRTKPFPVNPQLYVYLCLIPRLLSVAWE